MLRRKGKWHRTNCWKALKIRKIYIMGSNPTQFFFQKRLLDDLCCVALLFCCFVLCCINCLAFLSIYVIELSCTVLAAVQPSLSSLVPRPFERGQREKDPGTIACACVKYSDYFFVKYTTYMYV